MATSRRGPEAIGYYEGELDIRIRMSDPSSITPVLHHLDDLPHDAKLWRYMRLSTLMMHIESKVFIPSIEQLRHSDPMEAKQVCNLTHAYFNDLPLSDRNWLIRDGGTATTSERTLLSHPLTESWQTTQILLAIWDRELSRRRCAWCWHHGSIESMALWHIYGKEGVAVQTTPSRIAKTFQESYSVNTALIAKVGYVDEVQDMEAKLYFCRPYLMKQRCYRHENEVRVIVQRSPELANSSAGINLPRIDYRTLIGEVRISPNLPDSEAVAVKDVIRKLLGDEKIPVVVSRAKTDFTRSLDVLKLIDGPDPDIACSGSTVLPRVISHDMPGYIDA